MVRIQPCTTWLDIDIELCRVRKVYSLLVYPSVARFIDTLLALAREVGALLVHVPHQRVRTGWKLSKL